MRLRTELILLVVCSLLPGAAWTQQRRALTDISLDDLAADTQATPEGIDDTHLALAWWIPYEYWGAAFGRDPGMTEQGREEILAVLRGYSLLAVVQADIGALGNFSFYDEATVAASLEISVETSSRRQIEPLEDVDGDLLPLLGALRPILAGAMGNLGSNMHFFVLSDRDGDTRVVDPYGTGTLRIGLKNRKGADLRIAIETPINALFVPRTCANGKPAHVSWQFCPWDGKRL